MVPEGKGPLMRWSLPPLPGYPENREVNSRKHRSYGRCCAFAERAGWLGRCTPTPRYFVNVASKGFSHSVSYLESTVAESRGDADSKRFRIAPRLCKLEAYEVASQPTRSRPSVAAFQGAGEVHRLKPVLRKTKTPARGWRYWDKAQCYPGTTIRGE